MSNQNRFDQLLSDDDDLAQISELKSSSAVHQAKPTDAAVAGRTAKSEGWRSPPKRRAPRSTKEPTRPYLIRLPASASERFDSYLERNDLTQAEGLLALLAAHEANSAK
jgi:hypothetical protein